jgi:hypothetical protein
MSSPPCHPTRLAAGDKGGDGVQGGGASFDLDAAQAAHQRSLDAMAAQDPASVTADGAAVAAGSSAAAAAAGGSRRDEIARWTAETAAKMGVKLPPPTTTTTTTPPPTAPPPTQR